MAKKILVRFPDDLEHRFLAFPLLYLIYQDAVSAEKDETKGKNETNETNENNAIVLHIVTSKKNIEMLYLLPFNAFYHPLGDDDLPNMFTMHRACQYFNFGAIDVFYNLTPDLKDASIGLSLKIKDRVGFENGKTRWVLNYGKVFSENIHQSDNYLQFFTLYTNKTYDHLRVIRARALEKKEIHPWDNSPYLVFDLHGIVKQTKSEAATTDDEKLFWFEFFQEIKYFKIVFIHSSLTALEASPLIDEYISKLPTHNQYYPFFPVDVLALSRVISRSRIYMGHYSWGSHLASLLGIVSWTYYEKSTDRELRSPVYFFGNQLEQVDKLNRDLFFEQVLPFLST